MQEKLENDFSVLISFAFLPMFKINLDHAFEGFGILCENVENINFCKIPVDKNNLNAISKRF